MDKFCWKITGKLRRFNSMECEGAPAKFCLCI